MSQSIVFVPGAWHSSSCYEDLINALQTKAGYTGSISRVELPSVGSSEDSPARWTWFPDVQAIRTAIQAEVDADRGNILVVSHSYGSVPTQEALKEFMPLAAKGVIKQLIIAGFLLEPGECLMSMSGGQPAPWWIRQGDILFTENPAEIFYNDQPPEVQKKLVSGLKSHAYVTKISPLFHAAWMNSVLPTTYLVCLKDNANRLEWQEGGLERAMKKDGAVHIKVRKVDTDHSPFIGKISETMAVVEECLGGLR